MRKKFKTSIFISTWPRSRPTSILVCFEILQVDLYTFFKMRAVLRRRRIFFKMNKNRYAERGWQNGTVSRYDGL